LSSPLSKLPSAARKSLSAAFEAERLGPPYTSLALRRYVGAALAGDVAAELERLAALGMEPRHLGITLDLLAGEVESAPRIDLVWTGPEEGGTASRDTGVVVREMFERAEESVLVAGFAVYQGKQVFKVLADRMAARPNLTVQMFLNVQRPHRDTTLSAELLRRFSDDFRKRQWPGERLPDVYYDPRALDLGKKKRSALHAKCVIVDDRFSLVTSANFTEAAQERNIEAGVLIEDRALSQMLRAQFDGLVVARRLVRAPGL
jgi:hypothetical protein